MPIFRISNNVTKKLYIVDATNERQVQRLIENNLEEVLNVTFLQSEFSTSFGGRIDTLGIDKNGSPVIIEYKKSQNDSVINQGLSYLRWLLDHKANFENLCRDKNITIPIDWDSPRVICIAQSYNKFDIDTADLLPIKIELLKYAFYEDGILYLDSDNYQKVKVSISQIIKNETKQKKEVLQKDYSIEYHLKNADPKIKALFLKLREEITALDENIKEEPKKLYIAYKMATNFADVEVRSKDIKVFLNVKSGQLVDTYNLARDLTKPKPIGHWGNGDYEVKLSSEDEIKSVMALIYQSYLNNK